MKNNSKEAFVKEIRNYKSSVFEDLFYEDETAEENEISLYNALHEDKLPEGTLVRKIRIDNVIYSNFKNDISFGIGGKVIVFGEHQSTINNNMPLRSLMYVGRAYEQLVSVEDRYRKGLVQIPTPEFYTFYNGKEPYPAEQTLKLSDAFLTRQDEMFLELCVRVINIRGEEKHKILDNCQILREYTEFMECVEKHRATEADNAMELAVKECIKNGILKKYLERKGSEVVNMLIAEYDYATDIRIQREEAAAQGRQQGVQLGMELGIEVGVQNSIMELLQDYGDLPSSLDRLIREQKEEGILKKWLKLAAQSKSIEEFEEKLKSN